MEHRHYGTTGISISPIAFGGMRFADQKDIDACAALVQHAYDSGINYFDTAPGYGDSESLFGEAFKEMKKTCGERPWYVATKTFSAEPDDIRRQCEASLERMGIDCIDFYHMWCIIELANYESRKAQGALEAFEKLKEEGLIKHIVVSSHMTGTDIGTMLKDYAFEGVLLGYSAMNFAFREAALEAAAELKRGVVIMNPLGGGLIPNHPERFDFVRAGKDQTVVQGALRFLLSDPRITTALVGFSTTDEVDEAVQAAEDFTPYTPDEIEGIRTHLSEAFNQMCTGCGYCNICPHGIPVPKLMDAYNHQMLAGKARAGSNRLRWHWGIQPDSATLRACTKCGACEQACTQKLPITERIDALCDEAEVVLSEQKKK